MLQHGASQILGQALDVPTRFNVARQQAEERADGRVLVLGIDTGNDDFAAPQVERELAADIDTERLTDGLGQRDLPLEVSVAISWMAGMATLLITMSES